jgi:hypothetical protein
MDAYDERNDAEEAFSQALADARFVAEQERTWLDGSSGAGYRKKGSARAVLFEDADGASEGLAASRRYARRFESQTVGAAVHDVTLPGVGDEAWGLRVVLPGVSGHPDGYTASVTYSWRRDNLVLEVHVACLEDCPSDAGEAARSWAEAIDRKVRSVP